MKIDFNKLSNEKNISKSDLARMLFPGNKYPDRAFARIETGEAELSISQAKRLSELAGCSIDDLFFPERWSTSQSKSGKYTFVLDGRYKAELDKETWVTRIYDGETFMTETVLSQRSVSLAEYLDKIETIILQW